jgi:hypothetical protein
VPVGAVALHLRAPVPWLRGIDRLEWCETRSGAVLEPPLVIKNFGPDVCEIFPPLQARPVFE